TSRMSRPQGATPRGRTLFHVVVLPCLPFSHGLQRTLERQGKLVARLPPRALLLLPIPGPITMLTALAVTPRPLVRGHYQDRLQASAHRHCDVGGLVGATQRPPGGRQEPSDHMDRFHLGSSPPCPHAWTGSHDTQRLWEDI